MRAKDCIKELQDLKEVKQGGASIIISSLGSVGLCTPYESKDSLILGSILYAFSTLVTSLVHNPDGPN